MYLRTPKRYQVGHKRRHLFSTRWFWLWVLTLVAVIGGWQVYDRRDQLGPPVRDFISNAVDQAGGGFATMTAPTPLPTTNPADRIVRGDNAWEQGAIEQAVTEYGAAVSGAPNDMRVHYRYTYGLLIDGNYKDALDAAEHTVTANPFSADAWAIRALALADNQQYAKAIASGLQALSIDSNNATALAFMAQAYLAADQPGQAEEKANQALSIDPNNAEANYARGAIDYSSSFDFVSALDYYQTAHDLAPNLPQIMVEMAWTNWQLQNYDQGLDQLEQVAESNPNNLDALYALGFFQNQVYGDQNKAADYLNRCIQIDPSNISCLSYLGTVQTQLQDLQGAVKSYQRIIDVGTDNPRYYYYAGSTYVDLGDCNSAKPLLRTGYSMELSQTEPNNDRLAAFEEYMGQCGMPFNRVYSDAAQATAEGPLLIPLGGSQ